MKKAIIGGTGVYSLKEELRTDYAARTGIADVARRCHGLRDNPAASDSGRLSHRRRSSPAHGGRPSHLAPPFTIRRITRD